MPSLEVEVVPGLVLRDPFMVASSHWTSTQNAFRQLSAFRPSAVTLKTTSARVGGDGSDGKREKREVVNQFGDPFAYWSDGPKTFEFWDLATTLEMSRIARREFDERTVLGLSVLQGEDYSDLIKVLDLSLFGYVELNWKYTFRNVPSDRLADAAQEIISDLSQFLRVFTSLPVLVKLSRESLTHINLPFFPQMLSTVLQSGSGIIVANSLRARVPPSRLTKNSRELATGVIMGEHLFLDTYNAIRDLSTTPALQPTPPIVASGGIMDLGCTIDVMAAGADAVQLCSALDVRSLAVIDLLREQLSVHCKEHGDLASTVVVIRGSETNWATIATSAANETRDLEGIVSGALAETEKILDVVADSVALEATVIAENPIADRNRAPREAKIVVSRGNILSSHLTSRIAHELSLETVPLDSSNRFRKQLFDGKLRYDIAVVPKSVFDYMVLRGKSELLEREPIEIGAIGRSRVELVGDSRVGLEGIRTVHHFSGITGRRALENLLRSAEKKIEPYPIDSSQLLPTLRFWHQDAGILAKPPLSRIYGLLVSAELRPHWAPLWSWDEDLILVARKGFLEDEGGAEAARFILERMKEIAKEAVEDPPRAARSLMDGAYWSLFARLLGGRASW